MRHACAPNPARFLKALFVNLQCSICAPCSPLAVLDSVAPDPRVVRQLWGLTVRGERALRAAAPHWPAQQAAWGGIASDLLLNIGEPASWLSQLRASLLPVSATAPLVRLLLSCAATELKITRVAGVEPGQWISSFMDTAGFQGTAALSPTVLSFLLPRLAAAAPTRSQLFVCETLKFVVNMCRTLKALGGDSLAILRLLTSCHMSVHLSQLAVEVAVISQPTCVQAYWAVEQLALYAEKIAQESLHVVRQGRRWCPEVRASLAWPVMTLLYSPLLGLLASLQHVAIGASASVQSWNFPEGFNHLPPVHLLPAHMEPDSADSKLAMQVGLSFSKVQILLKHPIWLVSCLCSSLIKYL